MTKNICDSCKKQISGHFVSVAYDYLRNHKDFCVKCSKQAKEYLDELFNNLVVKADYKK